MLLVLLLLLLLLLLPLRVLLRLFRLCTSVPTAPGRHTHVWPPPPPRPLLHLILVHSHLAHQLHHPLRNTQPASQLARPGLRNTLDAALRGAANTSVPRELSFLLPWWVRLFAFAFVGLR